MLTTYEISLQFPNKYKRVYAIILIKPYIILSILFKCVLAGNKAPQPVPKAPFIAVILHFATNHAIYRLPHKAYKLQGRVFGRIRTSVTEIPDQSNNI